MLADGNGDYTRALGLELDARYSAWACVGSVSPLSSMTAWQRTLPSKRPRSSKCPKPRLSWQLCKGTRTRVPAKVPVSLTGCQRQFRKNLEQVANQSDVRNLKDRRFLILVDRHNRAGVLDAGHVLNGPGNADRNIEIRRNDLAGLADLQFVRAIARIDSGAGCADTGTQRVGQL